MAKKNKKIVFTEIVKKEKMEQTLVAPGKLEPLNQISVSSEFSGIIKKVHKKNSDFVNRDDLVLEIEQSGHRRDFLPLKLRANIKGRVSKISRKSGQFVNKGEHLFNITNSSETRIKMMLHQNSLIKVNLDNLAYIMLEKEKLPLVIESIDKELSSDSFFGEVILKPKAYNHKLEVGKTYKVVLVLNSSSTILLPESSLVYRGDKTFVRTVGKERKIFKIEVKLGKRSQSKREILKGIDELDEVVIKSSGYLSQGEEVQVKSFKK